ncbi:hypothetical protein ACIRPH_19765 [Nocardiopsis sp. NPDC101807]|uniref:hypothetical protein n=1 Tax=Nocardiopsis sp. NPDC101807 TaxID=3364339 RepID=UPI0037FDBCE4
MDNPAAITRPAVGPPRTDDEAAPVPTDGRTVEEVAARVVAATAWWPGRNP